ncbi:OsmC family protein [Candidatus Caldipriscus sp.]|nr:OsmC family protein [Candidatus Caldipriscus sp.]
MKINNVNLAKIQETKEKLEKGILPEHRIFEVSGEWVFDKLQFMGHVEYDNGATFLISDQIYAFGGNGNAPHPFQYILFGIMACYSMVFMANAASKGIIIRSLKAKGYIKVNVKTVLLGEDKPLVEKVGITLEVDTDASSEELEELNILTIKGCPSIYLLMNPIEFEPTIVKTETAIV